MAVEILIQNGAGVNVVNKDGKSALNLAASNGNQLFSINIQFSTSFRPR